MKLTLLEDLVCPCSGNLELTRALEPNNSQNSAEIISGWLRCGKCGENFPITRGDPRILVGPCVQLSSKNTRSSSRIRRSTWAPRRLHGKKANCARCVASATNGGTSPISARKGRPTFAGTSPLIHRGVGWRAMGKVPSSSTPAKAMIS